MSGIIQLIFVAALALISVPLFISRLGTEVYGVFAVISLTLTLPVFTNLGLNRSLVKFISQQDNSLESNYDIIVSISLLVFFTTMIVVLLIVFRNFIVASIFKIPAPFQKQAGIFFISALTAALFISIGQGFNAILSGLQKVWLNNLLQMIYNVLFYGSMILLLLSGYGIVEIGYGILVSSVCWMLLTIFFVLRIWGPVSFNGISVQFWRVVRKQLSFGIQVFMAEGIAWFIEPISKILISNFIGIREVGYFDIAIRVKALLQGILVRLFDPFFPYISQVQDGIKHRHIIRDVEQKFLLLSVPLLAMLIFVLSPLLDLWLGTVNNREITLASVFITCTFLATIVVLPFYYYLLSKDQANKAILINILTVTSNAVIFFIFLKLSGFYTSVIALCSSALINFIASLYYQKKLLGTGIFNTSKQLLNLLSAFMIMVAVNFLLYHFIGNPVLSFAIVIPVTILVMIIAYRYLRLITKDDVETYFGWNRSLSLMLQKVFTYESR